MARAPRRHAPDTTFHVTAHGVDDRAVFIDDVDRQTFVTRLGHMVERFEWTVYALCLMTTHYHLVVGLTEANLARGMSILNGAHARLFNGRHSRRGPVFERRYADRSIKTDEHLCQTIRYVALNPVEAGLVPRPQDWPWSTYAQLVGAVEPWPWFRPDDVLGLFSSRRDAAVRLVRSFVEGEQVPGTEVPGTN